jgi:glycosyltransferase involved in cell wall biosynthesis
MARVLVLNQYYSPDSAATGTYATAIAERLAQEGHQVEAIVGQPSYTAGATDAVSEKYQNGVLVTRIGLGRARGRERMVTRVIGYLRYMGRAAVVARRRSPDFVVCFHIQPPLPLLDLSVAARCGAALIYIPQDIHPDILLASGFLRLPRAAERAWHAMNRAVLGRADRTIALGEGMRTTLVEKGAAPEKVLTIPLWAEPELEPRPLDNDRRAELGLADNLVVLYAGNMGVMHPLEPVLQAAKRLENEKVAFIFTGSGVRRAVWEREAERLELTNVTFLDFQLGEDFARLVAAADVTLVSLELGMERLAVPSRSFAFLAAGRPIIAHMSQDADISQIVCGAQAGWHAWGANDLTDLLRRLLRNREEAHQAGQRARRVFEQRFRRSVVTGQYADVVSSLVSSGT